LTELAEGMKTKTQLTRRTALKPSTDKPKRQEAKQKIAEKCLNFAHGFQLDALLENASFRAHLIGFR